MSKVRTIQLTDWCLGLLHLFILFFFLKEKALELVNVLKIVDFKVSKDWFLKSKECHMVVFKRSTGRSWRHWSGSCRGLAPDIFVEPIGKIHQRWHIQRDLDSPVLEVAAKQDTHFQKVTAAQQGKRIEKRITILIGSNMSTTEKVPLLLFCKVKKPCCFKKKKTQWSQLTMKPWMTSKLI